MPAAIKGFEVNESHDSRKISAFNTLNDSPKGQYLSGSGPSRAEAPLFATQLRVDNWMDVVENHAIYDLSKKEVIAIP